ncbi:leucyl aminopeptidase [Bailinhaonella thermotolerans]|uniref:Probable cytosol aminopeptidase n=1 Tax=Bailinhaonella thermotolerans TaxID=1070861 RepID=A0A3A4B7I0_9ACTN|nr:leucyl aminopeptidase [Bailinhaonella thermotolerans]RJL33454.1 leucyl aminopeptidase [Bailinhaonella thermotolerans]
MPIQTSLTTSALPPGQADAIALPVRPGPEAAPVAGLPVPAETLLAHYEAKGEPGEIVEVPVPDGDRLVRHYLYGVGDLSPAALRRAGAALARRARGRGALDVRLPEDAAPEAVTAFTVAALLASYTFSMATGESRTVPVASVSLAGADPEAVRRGTTIARATALCRDLVNTPSSVKSPEWLADQAVAAAEEAVLGSRVWTEAELAAEGFGGILAVGQGSVRPPRMVELSYTPDNPDGRHVVIVGKGITFDSGGLSLKPAEAMKPMKTDMAGGATVIAVLSALRALGVRSRVTGLIAAAENLPSGSALRPGDVLTQYGGRTVEVMNTDAEGRLVLADALAYADANLDPDVMVDIATLTGAIKVALGLGYGGLFASDDALAAELLRAGDATGDRLWRLPLPDDYLPALDSPVADLSNVEQGSTFNAGSITAALFLREFTGKRPWAHLDIAGAGRSAADEGENTKGGTGFGTRALLHWLTTT